MTWRDQYRKCDACKREYRPQRQAQSYCSPRCKRAAAYGRERFAAGTVGARRRRLEASDKPLGIPIAGTVRNRDFSSIETIACKPTKPIPSVSFEEWPRCTVCGRWEMLPVDSLPRHMFCIAERKRTSFETRNRKTDGRDRPVPTHRGSSYSSQQAWKDNLKMQAVYKTW